MSHPFIGSQAQVDSGEKALWIYEYGSNAFFFFFFLEETKFSYIFICVTPHYQHLLPQADKPLHNTDV